MKAKFHICIFICFTLINCSDYLINEKQAGSLIINLSSNINRTIMPPGGSTVVSYDIQGMGPHGAQFLYSNITTNRIMVTSVVEGAWALIVYGKNSDGVDLVCGSTSIAVTKGHVTMANITASLLNVSGSLSIVLNWVEQVASPIVEASLTPVGGTPITLDFTYGYKSAAYANAQLTPGYYTLVIVLKDGTEIVWGAADAVLILPKQITAVSYYTKITIKPPDLFHTENGTNYLPVFTERWPSFSVPEAIRTLAWFGGGSILNFTKITNTNQAFEGEIVRELVYENNGGWWGLSRSFVIHTNSYIIKRINMNAYWNWNMSFKIKGSPISGTNVIAGIQSGNFGDGDNIKKMWTLADLGFTGTGDWETLTTNFSTTVNIDWPNMTFLFLIENNVNAIGSDTLLIDDVYWWIESVNHGVPNTNVLPNSIPNQITTNVDPAYKISYQQTKFVPAYGKVLFVVGQDKINIPHYYNTVGTSGGLASYISIATNDGITNDHFNTGDNIQNVDWLVQNYPNTVAQVAMWMVGVARYGVDFAGNTTNGQYDYVIDTFSE